MDRPLEGLEAPTAELLLDVRTPAELSFSPDGSRIAFALHATVANVGSFVPSDLYVVDVEGDEPPRQLTSGAWSDRTPAWSPDGSRLAFLSDRITPGHQLRTRFPSVGESRRSRRLLSAPPRASPGRATAPDCWSSPPIPAPTGSIGARAR